MRPIRGEGLRLSLTPAFNHAAKIATAAVGDFSRPRHDFNIRNARAAMQAVTAPALPFRSFRDTLVSFRAQAAFDEVWGRMQAAIDAAAANASLSPEMRAAAVRIMRERQKTDATTARRRVIEEEASAARIRRKMQPKQPRKPQC